MPIDSNPNPEYKRAMVVVAHPDDAEYGCSGTVAQWCSNGWEVVYVLCTDGSNLHISHFLQKVLAQTLIFRFNSFN